MKKIVAISILFLFVVACAVTYDVPLLYKKNYVPGTHSLLRFDGYYAHETNPSTRKPFFLYRDGSVWFSENYVDEGPLRVELAKKDPNIVHSWGNYKVEADTIVIERFHLEDNTNNYRRITLKGIILDGSIKWILREQNRQNADTLNYETKFRATTSKPDSTGNWTRTREQYNK